jgi:uncharacterized protein (UPF0333 family)
MKKKLMALALGVVAACSVAYAQIPVAGNINGTVVNGTVLNVNPGQTLTVGTIISVVSSAGSGNFMVVLVPSTNPPGNVSAAVNAINNAFNAFNVLGAMANGTLPNVFGSNAGEYSLNFIPPPTQVPFDLGLSAVLGAGAIAAVKQARKRKKEQGIA